MNRQISAMLAFAGVGLLVAAAATAGQKKPAPAGQSKPATPPPATEPAAPAKFIPPVRGQAELGYLKPVTKRAGSEIVTVIKVKNLANGPIAGLKVDEFWYDKAGDPVTGDTFRYKKLMMPGEVIEVTLRTPVNPKMDRNSYNFSHANGTIKTTLLPKL
ncbi:MAG TPA: hypothetical protein VGQ10_01625 [Vicinamibacterales bacterium]|jgi:hypothetical protein|nr:hypothetical protein [Vicinamibacterales bacterium]